MQNKLNVGLTMQAAPEQWGKKALISCNQNGVLIHYGVEESLNSIQKAARKLEAQGYQNIKLIGEVWDLEKCWAFWLGFRSPKNTDHSKIEWPLLDAADQKELALRFKTIDWVREVINLPSDVITPKILAQKAAQLLQSTSDVVTINPIGGEAELQQAGLIGVLNVSKGSINEGVFLEVDFNPTQDPDAPILASLVGKGITFDSGGYSIKPSSFMETMRADMGGAALLTGALAYAMAKGLTKRVKLYLCCAENMVSDRALKLGDLLHYPNGVSVEVTNTDAEGRLVLADGLIKASKDKADYLIDCATLTGAAKIAVGNDYHAILSFDDAMVTQFLYSAAQAKEPFWRLPLAAFHRTQMPSDFANINNSGVANTAGASTAAAFLSYFVEDYTKNWLHVDCSATFRKSATAEWASGATGIGVLTLATFLLIE